mmetsp:Transcript_14524/g.41853  ORF Transcript_14524/g.41853 Transcript_14524/m.41853 type:complete len:84 (-) Transcript_14524:208-459(-)
MVVEEIATLIAARDGLVLVQREERRRVISLPLATSSPSSVALAVVVVGLAVAEVTDIAARRAVVASAVVEALDADAERLLPNK